MPKLYADFHTNSNECQLDVYSSTHGLATAEDYKIVKEFQNKLEEAEGVVDTHRVRSMGTRPGHRLLLSIPVIYNKDNGKLISDIGKSFNIDVMMPHY